MRILRLSRTSIFRIAVLYLALLIATLTALLGIVYWSTSSLIEQQTGEIVDAEIRGLAEQYRMEGLGRLVEVIETRSGPGGNPESVYLLIASSGAFGFPYSFGRCWYLCLVSMVCRVRPSLATASWRPYS